MRMTFFHVFTLHFTVIACPFKETLYTRKGSRLTLSYRADLHYVNMDDIKLWHEKDFSVTDKTGRCLIRFERNVILCSMMSVEEGLYYFEHQNEVLRCTFVYLLGESLF